MSVAILIPENWEPPKLILWAAGIARAKNESLLIVRPKRGATNCKRKKHATLTPTADFSLTAALEQHAQDFRIVRLDEVANQKMVASAIQKADRSTRCVFVKHVDRSELVRHVLKDVSELNVTLLIIPRHRGVRFNAAEFAVERELLLEVPCETLQFRPGKTNGDDYRSILVASSGSKHARPALNIGAKLAASKAQDVTALYVNEHAASGAPAPTDSTLGHEVVKRFVRKSLRENSEIVRPDSVTDKDVPKGLSSYAVAKGHDLVIVGGGNPLVGEGPSRVSVPEKLLAEMDDQTVVVVTDAVPIPYRWLRLAERLKKAVVPQLDRQSRIDLVKRLQAGSSWDFDFCLLICLATMLASLGLCVDSSPVVIGAMLVAPLMTPMLGLGLSVVQSNQSMAKSCLTTISRGFAAAFMTGCFVGIMRASVTWGMTNEMTSRCAPGSLDLLVAFVSGIVAAYALGRPHLLSVLPGIAIATSLVPPVAAAGLSLCILEFDAALGATLLFLSNFISIVLGASVTLWLVGMRGPRELGPLTGWTRRCVLGMFLVAAGLAIGLTAREAISHEPAVRVAANGSAQDAAIEFHTAHRPIRESAISLDVAIDDRDEDALHTPIIAGHHYVQVVLKPRATGGKGAPIVDVTLIVPSEPHPVALDGIVARRCRPGWIALEFPPLEHWARPMRGLDVRLQQSLLSPDFYRSLKKLVSQQFAPELAPPLF